MSSTYEKLGQYSGTELPQAPTDVSVYSTTNTRIILVWTNNSTTYTGATNVVQLWQGNYWETVYETSIDSDAGMVDDLSEGTNYRLRVAVLLDGILYPSMPLTQTTTAIPKPQNVSITSIDYDSMSIEWDGYDESWENTFVVYYQLGGEVFTGSTLAATATTFTVNGLTATTATHLDVFCTIDGEPVKGGGVTDYTSSLSNPYGLAASDVTTDSMTLTWTNQGSYDSVKVYQSLDDSDWTLIATLAESAETTDVTGLTQDTTYYFKVCAYGGYTEECGESISQATQEGAPVPVLHWTFDNTITDEIQSLTLTEASGTASYATGINGANALVLDDTAPNWFTDNSFDYASVFNRPNSGSEYTDGLYTVMFWWYANPTNQIVSRGYPFALTSDAVSLIGHRFSIDSQASGADGLAIARIGSSGILTNFEYDGIDTAFSDDTWYHIAFRVRLDDVFIDFDGFLDGVLAQDGTNSDDNSYAGEITDYTLNIGNRGVARTDYALGRIQNLRIYDSALTDEQIIAIYNAEKPA